MFPSKISKDNLLRYAESIGGKSMYFGFRRALREAGVFNAPELNLRQVNNIVKKYIEASDTTLDRTRLKELIGEHEGRRQAYVRMAIESEMDEEGGVLPGMSITLNPRERYEYKKNIRLPKGVKYSVGSSSATSAARINPKNTAIRTKPTTSISRLNK